MQVSPQAYPQAVDNDQALFPELIWKQLASSLLRRWISPALLEVVLDLFFGVLGCDFQQSIGCVPTIKILVYDICKTWVMGFVKSHCFFPTWLDQCHITALAALAAWLLCGLRLMDNQTPELADSTGVSGLNGVTKDV